MHKTLLTFLAILLLMAALAGCGEVADRKTGSQPIEHTLWDSLLTAHVAQDGVVNYAAFVKDSTALNRYLHQVSQHYPDESTWSREEQLAYWINAYNAFTVQLILRHYPLKSIKDIGSSVAIPFINSVWDIKFIEIEGEEYDLNNIEHGILRKKFDEPRIHFAINCASFSCPLLRAEAYDATNIDAQLTEQAVLFINDSTRNQIKSDYITVSKILSWFSGDFTKEGTLIDYLNQYSRTSINPDARVEYMDYNWSLNDIKSN